MNKEQEYRYRSHLNGDNFQSTEMNLTMARSDFGRLKIKTFKKIIKFCHNYQACLVKGFKWQVWEK